MAQTSRLGIIAKDESELSIVAINRDAVLTVSIIHKQWYNNPRVSMVLPHRDLDQSLEGVMHAILNYWKRILTLEH